VRDLAAVYVSHGLSGGAGIVELAKGTFALSALYKGEWFSDIVRFSAGLQGTFSGRSWDAFSPRPFSQDISGRLSLVGITVDGTAMPPWGVALRTERGALRFDGGPGESIHGTLDPDTSFRFSTGSPLPVAAKAEGRIVGDRLVSTIDVASIDVRVLNAMMKSPIVSFTSGVASGRVAIDGPVNDPDYLGSLELIGGGLLCRRYSPDEAGPISTRITFDRKIFRTDRVVASVGGARMSGQAQFMVDHWVPVGFEISLATEPGTPVRLAASFGSLIADGKGVGQARIVGNERRTDITGSLVVTDCRITLGPYPGGEFVAEDPPTFVTFTAETGKRVEFSWPSEAFPVVRTTASPGGRIAITYRGDTGGYTVKGSTNLLGGEIFYFDRSFIVKSGTIGFDESEKAFDPRITARAEVREWDPRSGEEVKIYLDADSKLSEFSPRFSSDPSRTDVDILAMIGAPIFGRAEEQGLGMSALMLSSDILSQFGILRPFERKVRELLNLDMFSIRTQLIQNLVAEKLFGAAVNPLDNTAVSLGKYLGNDLFLEMLVRLQSRPTAPGELSPAIGLRSDLELNLEWATPFFLLEWSFLPRTPETLFLADNSLSMKWRYSY
jgi:translocation and assembly module TamB